MFRRRVSLFVIFSGFTVFLLGQQALHVSFDWNSPKFHELGYSRSQLLKTNILSKDSKSALIRAISARLRPHMADLEIADEKELRAIAEQSRFELLDLNGDGIPEVIVQPIGLKAGCGATGNCPLWIFSRGPKQYRLLVEIDGVQMYRQERGGNQGYSDIAVATHDSASESHIYVYRYTGGKYKATACYDAWWIEAKSGPRKRLNRPSITSCPVSEAP